MIKTFLKSASLAAAGTIFIAGIALADPGKYPYIPDTEPQMQSKSQPLARPATGPKSIEVFEDGMDTRPVMSSRHQRVAHEPLNRYEMTDQVDPILPRPLRW